MPDSNIQPYPMMFDPSQWLNKYSQFNTGTQMPGWPTQYAGTPTDAMGRPIQSFLDAQSAGAQAPMAPSTTLNSNPSQWALNNDMYNAAGRQLAMGQRGGMSLGDIVDERARNNAAYGMTQPVGGPVLQSSGPQAAQGQQAARAPQGQPAGTMDMSAAYLNALSNPGKVTTPGATVPQAPLPTGQSNVLQSFLQNWRPGANPAGNYNNIGAFNALKNSDWGSRSASPM